jgi:cytochrome c oxidase assembly protein subunit 15
LERVDRLATGFAALAGITYALIVLGALVRANGAGLACPDWPLCFGRVIPSFDLRIAFEWGHRALAGTVSLIFLALVWSSLRNPRARCALGSLLGVAASLLALQVLLGALTVWHLLAAWSVTSHLLAGNAFAIVLVLSWRQLRELEHPTATEAPVPGPLRWGVALAAAVLLAQLTLGGLVSSSYAGLACPDWPTCRDGVWFPSFAGVLGIQLSHRLGAYAFAALLLACLVAARGVGALCRLLAIALGLTVVQIGVGVTNVLTRLPVEVTAVHSALAAALTCLLALSVREAWRGPS